MYMTCKGTCSLGKPIVVLLSLSCCMHYIVGVLNVHSCTVTVIIRVVLHTVCTCIIPVSMIEVDKMVYGIYLNNYLMLYKLLHVYNA